jgi:hypothetical protein
MGDVVDRVRRDLERIERLDPELAGSGLAGVALALAARMDDVENSATSVSMCGRALTDALEQLRELTPVEDEGDRIDDLADRRSRRVAAAAG